MGVECSVRPEEVPDIPENKFLMRYTIEGDKEEKTLRGNGDYSRSGRKFKGRGIKVSIIGKM